MKQLENPKEVAWRQSEAYREFKENVIEEAKNALIKHFNNCETLDEVDEECSAVKSDGLVCDYFTVYADMSYTTKYFDETYGGDPGSGIDRMYFENIEVEAENPFGHDETFEIKDFNE